MKILEVVSCNTKKKNEKMGKVNWHLIQKALDIVFINTYRYRMSRNSFVELKIGNVQLKCKKSPKAIMIAAVEEVLIKICLI